MTLRLTATTVKQFFEYRCERQVRYDLLADGERLALLGLSDDQERPPWAQAGIDFEAVVVAELARREPVLRPPPGERLSPGESDAFLRRHRGEPYAAQLVLPPPAGSLPLPPGVELA